MYSRKHNINLVKITCLSTFLLNTIIITSAQLSVGNYCTMNDGKAGTCVLHSDCDFWKIKMKNGQYPRGSDQCGYQNMYDVILCCPKQEPTGDPIIWPDDGHKCTMEINDEPGICVPIKNCLPRIIEVLEGRRFHNSPGRCSYDGADEIVCCPITKPTPLPTPTTTVTPPINLRPADQACQEYNALASGKDGKEINTNIIGGQVALPGELPFMAALGYRIDRENPSNISYICGGSLITERHVLTAAHCASNINNYVPIEVRLGSVDLRVEDKDTQRIPIKHIEIHPEHRPSMNYFDIAIIEMSRPANLKRNKTMPICLQTIPNSNLAYAIKKGVIVAGWGVTVYNAVTPSNVLRYTRNLTLIDTTKCADDYRTSNKLPQGIDDSMICVLDENPIDRSDACQGDSGGPLFLNAADVGTLYGIVSFGQSCASSLPSIYSSVFFHLDWIEKIIFYKKKTDFKN